jgi:hypothetical protein
MMELVIPSLRARDAAVFILAEAVNRLKVRCGFTSPIDA